MSSIILNDSFPGGIAGHNLFWDGNLDYHLKKNEELLKFNLTVERNSDILRQ